MRNDNVPRKKDEAALDKNTARVIVAEAPSISDRGQNSQKTPSCKVGAWIMSAFPFPHLARKTTGMGHIGFDHVLLWPTAELERAR